ncbi:MAG: hypothetical protein ACYDCQ_11740 [Dehalococcoidia bacterium]
MFRRFSLVLALALLFVTGSVAPRLITPGNSARADSTAMASVFPDSGTLSTNFTFSASGLTPGHAVDIALFDAVGNRYTYQKDGVDQGIIIDQSGNAALNVTPATDLSGPTAGPWRAVFQEEETGLTATIVFNVSP